MASTDRPTIRVRSIQDVLALIPFLLGFQPEDSLVLVAVTRGGVPFTARLDLPDPDQPPAALHAAVDLVTGKLATLDNAGVILVGYGSAESVQPAVTVARGALRHAGIPISDVLRVADGRFWRDSGTQPPGGVPFDPSTNPATAAAVYAGLVALPGRDALVDTLAPVTGAARDRMAIATATACDSLIQLLDAAGAGTGDPDAALRTPVGRALQTAARTVLTQAQDSYRAGRPVDDDHAAILTVLLALPALRDVAARRTSREAWQVEMWTDLVRRAEPPFTAGPATLLALCALHGGNGALAGVAIRRGLDADPDDRLGQLLAAAIAAGIDPDTVAALLAD